MSFIVFVVLINRVLMLFDYWLTGFYCTIGVGSGQLASGPGQNSLLSRLRPPPH